MNNWRIDNYTNIKNLFNDIANQNINDIKVSFTENKDVLALKLKFEYNARYIEFYYVFGNNQVIEIDDKDGVYVAPINVDSLQTHIQFQLDEYIKNWKKEETKCA